MEVSRKTRSNAARAPAPVDRVIGQRIRAARLKLKISQRELGKQLGITYQQIYKYAQGTNRVSSSRMADLAKVLNMRVEDFFDEAPVRRFDAFIATREGVQIIKAMMKLSPQHQQVVINLARSLAALSEP
jgi:transcriptional regulator with XRE-family HTH domain